MEGTWRDQLEVPVAKLEKYLLAVNHPVGGPKAVFFLRFGFSPDEPGLLRDVLLNHGRTGTVKAEPDTEHGSTFVVEGPIDTPRGAQVLIRSVWIQLKDDATVRFVTAYPIGR